MQSPHRSAILGGAAALALSFAVASAQTAPPADAHAHRGPRVEDDHGGRWIDRDPAEMRRHRADHLRTLLQLTPQQEPALQAFLTAMKPPGDKRHTDMAALHGPGGAPDPARMEKRHAEMEAKRQAELAMTTPQRLDEMAGRMAEHAARLQARIAAVKTFYASLTPSQQKVFDTLHEGGMHHSFGHRFGLHEHWWGEHGRGEMGMGMRKLSPGER